MVCQPKLPAHFACTLQVVMHLCRNIPISFTQPNNSPIPCVRGWHHRCTISTASSHHDRSPREQPLSKIRTLEEPSHASRPAQSNRETRKQKSIHSSGLARHRNVSGLPEAHIPPSLQARLLPEKPSLTPLSLPKSPNDTVRLERWVVSGRHTTIGICQTLCVPGGTSGRWGSG